jgi:hypothetical protein
MPDLPHIALPWTLQRNGKVTVHEQDSVEEIAACVVAITSCVKGQVPMLPDLGVPSPLFTTTPIDTAALVEAASAQEPRAVLAATDQPDVLNAAIRHILSTAQIEEGPS